MKEENDLARKWLLDVDAAGIVTIRERGVARPFDIKTGEQRMDGLPAFSTDLESHAVALRDLHCVAAMDAEGNLLHQLVKPPTNVRELLTRIGPMFRKSYKQLLAKKA